MLGQVIAHEAVAIQAGVRAAVLLDGEGARPGPRRVPDVSVTVREPEDVFEVLGRPLAHEGAADVDRPDREPVDTKLKGTPESLGLSGHLADQIVAGLPGGRGPGLDAVIQIHVDAGE